MGLLSLLAAIQWEHTDEYYAVSWDFGFELVSVRAYVFLAPEVADPVRAFYAEVFPEYCYVGLGFSGVEQADCFRAVFHILGHNEILLGFFNNRGLLAQRILVDLDDLGIAEDIECELIELFHIA